MNLKLFNELDNLLDNLWELPAYRAESWKLKDGVFSFNIVMAGVKKEDIDVQLIGDQLQVKWGNNCYAISMPQGYDANSVEASLDLGVLRLTAKEHVSKGTKIVVR